MNAKIYISTLCQFRENRSSRIIFFRIFSYLHVSDCRYSKRWSNNYSGKCKIYSVLCRYISCRKINIMGIFYLFICSCQRIFRRQYGKNTLSRKYRQRILPIPIGHHNGITIRYRYAPQDGLTLIIFSILIFIPIYSPRYNRLCH